jgi:hypothetical protein
MCEAAHASQANMAAGLARSVPAGPAGAGAENRAGAGLMLSGKICSMWFALVDYLSGACAVYVCPASCTSMPPDVVQLYKCQISEVRGLVGIIAADTMLQRQLLWLAGICLRRQMCQLCCVTPRGVTLAHLQPVNRTTLRKKYVKR